MHIAEPVDRTPVKFFTFVVWACFMLATPTAAEPLYETPVYNPETKSYFELARVVPGSSTRGIPLAEAGWMASTRLAARRVFKNAHGRLAVVKTKQVNDFLRVTFGPDTPAWIGLRYLCRYNKLQWVTGEIHPLDAYSNWDRRWKSSGGESGKGASPYCNPGTHEFWPVHYWRVSEGFRWNANGTTKEFYAYFVEYPTGGE